MVKWYSNGQIMFNGHRVVKWSKVRMVKRNQQHQRSVVKAPIRIRGSGSVVNGSRSVTVVHVRSRSVTVVHGQRSGAPCRRWTHPGSGPRSEPCYFASCHSNYHMLYHTAPTPTYLFVHRFVLCCIARHILPAPHRTACGRPPAAAPVLRLYSARVTAGDGDPGPSCAAFSYIL